MNNQNKIQQGGCLFLLGICIAILGISWYLKSLPILCIGIGVVICIVGIGIISFEAQKARENRSKELERARKEIHHGHNSTIN